MTHGTSLRQRAFAVLVAACLALMAGPLAAHGFKLGPPRIDHPYATSTPLRFQKAGERAVTVWMQRPRGPASPHAAAEHKH